LCYRTAHTALQTSARTGASSVSRTANAKLTPHRGDWNHRRPAGAGLLLNSFLRLRSADVGCVTENMLTLQYSLPEKKYDKPENVNAFNEALLERVRIIPRVGSVALGNTLPAAGYWGDYVFTVKEHPPLKAGAVGRCGPRLHRSGFARFSARSNASAPNRVQR
jgi:hypothetical protein